MERVIETLFPNGSLWPVALVVLAFVLLTSAIARWPMKILFRFVTGRPMDGVKRTDSTFLRPAGRDLTTKNHANAWDMKPGWFRASIRVGVSVGAFVVAVGYLLYPTLVTIVLWLSIAGAAVVAGIRIFRMVRDRRHVSKTVKPIYEVIRKYYVHELPSWDRKHFWISRDYHEPTGRVVLSVPKGVTIDNTARYNIKNELTQRLGVEWQASWSMDAEKPFVEWRPVPEPPKKVPWDSIRTLAEDLPNSQLFYGLDEGHSTEVVDLDSDTPHVLLSIGTGGGKSATLMLMILQLMKKPDIERIIIIDPKMKSLNVFSRVEGVLIYRHAMQWQEAVGDFYGEMERRKNLGNLEDDDDDGQPKPYGRWVMVVEELNTFAALSEDHWRGIKDKGDPKMPPWISQLALILFQARQFNMNVIAVGQEVTAATVGSNAARSQFGYKVLARFSPQVYKQITGASRPTKIRNVIGRHLIIKYGHEKAVQVAFTSKGDIKKELKRLDYRISGLDYAPSQPDDVAYEAPVVPSTVQSNSQDGEHDHVTDGTGQRPRLQVVHGGANRAENAQEIEDDQERYTLSEASHDRGHGIVPMNYETLRKNRNRAESQFPDGTFFGREQKYTEDELIRWYNSRPNTKEPVKPLSQREESDQTGTES